jgi:hypothetical protein
MKMNLVAIYQLWAVIGPLVGVALGAWLTGRWQRKQWRLNNEMLEYRQLLDAFSTYRHLAIRRAYDQSGGGIIARTPQSAFAEADAVWKAEADVHTVIADRLFIRKAMVARNVLGMFERLAREIDGADTAVTLAQQKLGEFHDELLRLAEKGLGLCGS